MNDLIVQHVTKMYRSKRKKCEFSIQGINLHVQEGERFAIVGPSGCGKTTLLKCVAGLLTPDEGKVLLGKEDITKLPTEKRGFGMVFQQPLLFPHMTVIENTAFGLKMNGWRKKERNTAAEQVLAAVGLKGYEHRYPNELSGGQQQRVSLARAIVTRPKLLLLDEPFSSLDPGIRCEMHELVKQIHRQYKTTFLFVTHDREEAFDLADRIAVMNNGSVLQVGTPLEIYTQPATRFVAQFIGAGNLVKGDVKQGIFRSDAIQVELPENLAEGTGWLLIRPELLQFVSNESDAWIKGRITDIKWRKGFRVVQVNAGNTTLEAVEQVKTDNSRNLGDQVYFTLDTKQLYFIPESER